MLAHVFLFKHPREQSRYDKVAQLHEYDRIKYIITWAVPRIGIPTLDSLHSLVYFETDIMRIN